MTITNDPQNLDPRDVVGRELVDEITTLVTELSAMRERVNVLGPQVATALRLTSDRCNAAVEGLPNRGEIAPRSGFYQDHWFEATTLELNCLTAHLGELFEAAASGDPDSVAEVISGVQGSLLRAFPAPE